MRIIFLLAALVAVGCTTPPKVKDPGRTTQIEQKDGSVQTVTESDQAVFNKTVLEVLSRPLVKITCQPTCSFASFEVGMPINNAGLELLAKPRDPAPELHPVAQTVREFFQPIKEVALAGLPAFITGSVAKSAFGSLERTATALASQIQAPAGTSVVISGSNGVGALGGTGSYSTSQSQSSVMTTTTTDASNRWAIDIICSFAATTGSPPSYCAAR